MFHRKLSLVVLVATTATAFIPYQNPRFHHVKSLSMAPDEEFQRSLLEARLKYEGKLESGVFLDSMEAEQQALKREAEKKAIEENELPPGWEAMKDPESGRTFYVDHANQFTTWTRPSLNVGLGLKNTAKEKEAEKLAAKQEAEAKAAEEKAAAELAAKQEAEAEKARAELAAMQEAEAKAAEEKAAAELAAKQEEEKKFAEEKAAAELVAKQEAEAKAAEEAAAELAAKQEAEAKAAEEKAAAELAAKQEAEAKAAEQEAAELAAKQEAEAKAAEQEAAAELAAKQEAEAKAAEEEAAELAAKQEAEAKAAEEKAAAELAAEQERAAAAEKIRAELAAKQEAEAKAAEERRSELLDSLVSRNQELKQRVRTFAERIKNISWRNILPSSETLTEVTSAIKEFKPKEAALGIKSREESNTELIGIVAAGATNVVIDGLGTGVELADAVRSDDEFKSVVGDALDSTGEAFSALVSDVKKTDKVTPDSLKRQAEFILCALDSAGSAAFASLCAVVGYSQGGSPVAESASKATNGLFKATSAAVALGLRGFDVVANQYGEVAKQAKEVAKMAQELDDSSSSVEAVDHAGEETIEDSQELGIENKSSSIMEVTNGAEEETQIPDEEEGTEKKTSSIEDEA